MITTNFFKYLFKFFTVFLKKVIKAKTKETREREGRRRREREKKMKKKILGGKYTLPENREK